MRGGSGGDITGLYVLQPIVTEWRDATTLHGWKLIDEAVNLAAPIPVSDRGYFIGIKNDHLLITPRYARHPDAGLLVDELTAIPMSEVISISPRKETMRERLVRLKNNRTKGV